VNKKLSIIIPTYNTAALTLQCIDHIQAHPPSSEHEVIVVDNHSSDSTLMDVQQKHPEVILIANDRNLGFSCACNRGAAVARGENLLFLNSDTEALEHTFDQLLDWLDKNPHTGIVGPELIGPQNQLLQMSWGWHPLLLGELIQQYFAPYAVRKSRFRRDLIKFIQRRSRKVPSICGACLMIRRDVFNELKGFDEDFELYFEDSDLCIRCVNAGRQIDFVRDAKIIHHLGQSTRGGWNKTTLIYQQSHITFYRKHARPWSVWLLKFYLLFKWLRLRIVSLKEGEQKRISKDYCERYFQMITEKSKIELDERPRTP
jgi:GT2 family glycosyltransferase